MKIEAEIVVSAGNAGVFTHRRDVECEFSDFNFQGSELRLSARFDLKNHLPCDDSVYVIEERPAGVSSSTWPRMFKIGKAKKPSRRLKCLQTGNSSELDIVALSPGGLRFEAALHNKFAKQSARGEFFSLSMESFHELLLCVFECRCHFVMGGMAAVDDFCAGIESSNKASVKPSQQSPSEVLLQSSTQIGNQPSPKAPYQPSPQAPYQSTPQIPPQSTPTPPPEISLEPSLQSRPGLPFKPLPKPPTQSVLQPSPQLPSRKQPQYQDFAFSSKSAPKDQSESEIGDPSFPEVQQVGLPTKADPKISGSNVATSSPDPGQKRVSFSGAAPTGPALKAQREPACSHSETAAGEVGGFLASVGRSKIPAVTIHSAIAIEGNRGNERFVCNAALYNFYRECVGAKALKWSEFRDVFLVVHSSAPPGMFRTVHPLAKRLSSKLWINGFHHLTIPQLRYMRDTYKANAMIERVKSWGTTKPEMVKGVEMMWKEDKSNGYLLTALFATFAFVGKLYWTSKDVAAAYHLNLESDNCIKKIEAAEPTSSVEVWQIFLDYLYLDIPASGDLPPSMDFGVWAETARNIVAMR